MATVVGVGRLSAEEKRWREESDVRTLAEAEKIQTDRSRLNAATKRAKSMAADAMKEANAVKAVAAKKVPTTRKPAATKGKGGTARKATTTRKKRKATTTRKKK